MVRRGEIYFVELNPVAGREQAGRRPVFIMGRRRRADANEHEVALRGQRLDAGVEEPLTQQLPRRRGRAAPLFDQVGLSQARRACRERRAIDVERLLDDVEQARELEVGHGVAEPEAREPEELRQRVQHDHRPPRLHVALAAEPQLGVDVVGIGLIGDGDATLRPSANVIVPRTAAYGSEKSAVMN